MEQILTARTLCPQLLSIWFDINFRQHTQILREMSISIPPWFSFSKIWHLHSLFICHFFGMLTSKFVHFLANFAIQRWVLSPFQDDFRKMEIIISILKAKIWMGKFLDFNLKITKNSLNYRHLGRCESTIIVFICMRNPSMVTLKFFNQYQKQLIVHWHQGKLQQFSFFQQYRTKFFSKKTNFPYIFLASTTWRAKNSTN